MANPKARTGKGRKGRSGRRTMANRPQAVARDLLNRLNDLRKRYGGDEYSMTQVKGFAGAEGGAEGRVTFLRSWLDCYGTWAPKFEAAGITLQQADDVFVGGKFGVGPDAYARWADSMLADPKRFGITPSTESEETVDTILADAGLGSLPDIEIDENASEGMTWSAGHTDQMEGRVFRTETGRITSDTPNMEEVERQPIEQTMAGEVNVEALDNPCEEVVRYDSDWLRELFPLADHPTESRVSIQYVYPDEPGDVDWSNVTLRLVLWSNDNGSRCVENIKEQPVSFFDGPLDDRSRAYLQALCTVIREALQANAPCVSLLPVDFFKFRSHPLGLKTPQTVEDFAAALRVKSRLGKWL